MRSLLLSSPLRWAVLAVSFTVAGQARAQEPTPGFAEAIMQWGVQPGQTCADISQAVYGSPAHTDLLLRYNAIGCEPGAVIAPGLTLVLPAKVNHPPAAQLTDVNPEVRARAGGGWATGYSGQALTRGANVNTLAKGRAGIQFVDRTRIYLGPLTLVVIYDTARGSAVSKVEPAAVELESGEVQAGISALRGGTVHVAVAGGGSVVAASREAVVARKGQRTTVGVHQGSAEVTSAGASVRVPLHHGTHFVEAAPPAPPRPLPPAPSWASSSPPVVLGASDGATLRAAWQPVAGAKAYRFEVSPTPSFASVLVREEVGSEVLAFRAEKLPAGRYHLRVRAIDGDDYLGIASEARAVTLVHGTWQEGTGKLEVDAIEASPYGVLALSPMPGHSLALDEAPFGALPAALDFARLRPGQIRLRRDGDGAEHVLAVRYTPVTVTVVGQPGPTGVDARVTLSGLDNLDVAGRVGPRLRLRRGATSDERALVADGAHWRANLGHLAEPVRVDVVDGSGRLLGSAEVGADGVVEALGRRPRLGATRPLASLSPRADIMLLPPRLRTAAVLGVALGRDAEGRSQVQGSAFATGQVAALGLDALVRTNPTGPIRQTDTTAWLGVRYALLDIAEPGLQISPALRLALPMSRDSAPARLEPSVSVGGLDADWTWVVNLGGRARLHESTERTFVDKGSVYLSGGGTRALAPWLRVLASLDAQVLIDEEASIAGGLAAGVEAGTQVFGSVGGHLSPFTSTQGLYSVQIGFGLRGLE